ncbi:MAG: (2Fe-2S)-binding protein [bacterium]|nr:MAG: (2Fe-2S)-binding protein [bacterium]
MEIDFRVNSNEIHMRVSPKKRLLDILREDLDLVGTKEGCGKGECGACTVLMNGKRVNSCLIPALQLPGSHIVTIEGLQNWEAFSSIERAYIEHGAVQCGFCMSGFVMSTAAFLAESSLSKLPEQIKWELAGNLCRCTGYKKIIEAVHDLSQQQELIQQIRNDWQNAFGVR